MHIIVAEIKLIRWKNESRRAYLAEDVIENHISLHPKRYYEDLQQSVIGEIDSIVEQAMERKRSRIVDDPTSSRRSLGVVDSSRQAPNYGNDTVGFDEVLLKLKARLCGESDARRVISIVGMGGIGKTTLAKTIFDDSPVVYHFDVRVWITISQEYCIRDILLCLLKVLKVTSDDVSKKSNEILAEHVYKSLEGRRYLIVMDDMWSTKAWDDIRRVLSDDTNGSRVIITTRLSEVAIYAESLSPPQQMKLLNKDQSWSLLQKKVFGKELCPLELREIGKMIAGKCGGLPLGIVLVAGLLSKVDAMFNYWEKFAVNVSSILATNDERLFKILSLSYNNLPHHLRACFLYMGGFPEDSEISISKLTMLWTAEGFFKSVTSKSSKEVGEEYVVDLAKRNLISITRMRSNGRFRLCRVHDLLRDFCIQKSHEENFLHVIKNDSATREDIQNKRLCNLTNCSVPTKTSDTSVRSHRFSNNNQQYLTSLAISSRMLKVLDGPNVRLTCFPMEVTELVHLRYLAFSLYHYVHFVVPPRILELRNLQTLISQNKYCSLPSHYFEKPRTHLPREI